MGKLETPLVAVCVAAILLIGSSLLYIQRRGSNNGLDGGKTVVEDVDLWSLTVKVHGDGEFVPAAQTALERAQAIMSAAALAVEGGKSEILQPTSSSTSPKREVEFHPSVLPPPSPPSPVGLPQTLPAVTLGITAQSTSLIHATVLPQTRTGAGVNFTVAWEPAKRAPSSQLAADLKPAPAQWEKAAAEAARRIRAAENVVSAEVNRKALAEVTALENKLTELGKKKPNDGQAEMVAVAAKLVEAQIKHQAILDAEAHLVQHREDTAAATASAAAAAAAVHHSELDPTWQATLKALESVHVTYESCVASLPTIPKAKTLHDLNWIHVPKAGTTFATTLYGYLCTAEKQPIESITGETCSWCGPIGKANHGSLQWDPKTWPLIPFETEPYCDWNVAIKPKRVFSNHFSVPRQNPGALVTLLRDPRQRLVSAWNNNKHSYGATGSDRKAIEATQTLHDFIVQPGISSCQTKMVLGLSCAGDKTPISAKQLEIAKRVIREQFSFVGVTGSFNASICLFHHMFGGAPRDYSFQAVGLERSSDFLFKHYHRTPKFKPLPGGGKRVPSEAWKQVSVDSDPNDWELYQTAVTLFIDRLKSVGLLSQ
jgi:hypothetical protein